ncbi:MAG: sarcosine oxidase subunit alpha family protein [Betaproteobacteria bacterium]
MTMIQKQSMPRLPETRPGNKVNFTFDGRKYVGREGDTLAAALLANGVSLVGRSFKLHRPRGLMGAGVDEPNGLVQLESGGYGEPNVRATLVTLYEGLEARSQNAWPSVKFDMLGVMDKFASVLPASFYYKSMMFPNWAFYERFVRPIAGLGRVPTEKDAQSYQRRNLHCDILVCGGGPGGLMAALAAGRSGLRVVLVDDKEGFGGSLLGETLRIDGMAPTQWVADMVRTLPSMPNVRLLPRTTVSGYYENNVLAAAERVGNHLGRAADPRKPRERLWRIRATKVILATGALERPLVFPNNDRPGVMLASAVRFYANRFGVLPGQCIVLVTNNDTAYRTAFDLHDMGERGLTLVDTRRSIHDDLKDAARTRGIELLLASGVHDVQSGSRLKSVTIASHLGDGLLGGDTRQLPCDVLAMSGGWTPTTHLYSQAGGQLSFDDRQICLRPEVCAQDVRVIGAANGDLGLSKAAADGYLAGARAAEKLTGRPVPKFERPCATEVEHLAIQPFWFTRNRPTNKQWLDFQYDVKVSDIEFATQENFISVEHVKRYTTGGMSVDQGKSSNFNILGVMAELTGRKIPQVGTTRFRPPFHPVTIGTFAGPTVGEHYSPWQELPAHAFHAAQNAQMGDYSWRRPDFYPIGNEEIAAATRREVLAVRSAVGLFDGSPLGKIEVKGPDAAVFLNRMYVNNMLTLKPGAARYGLLTNENGALIDDGVIVRLAQDHFLVHATSGGVNRAALLFEQYLQCEWPELKVHINNVTTQWSNVTVSGPLARKLVSKLDSDIDFSKESFAHMQYREGLIAGVPARVLRASFTGEVTFEISVYARYGRSLWELLHSLGQEYGVTPYGIEALEVMRTEKGYLHVGADSDATTNPLDVGWEKVVDKKADDFVGRRSLNREGDRRSDRLQLVGLESVDPRVRLPIGGHVVAEERVRPPIESLGYVTSACMSPMLDKAVGMGLVRSGFARMGEHVFIYDKGEVTAARIVAAAHFDPKGDRLNA